MSHPARESIYEAISSIRLIDPHTHINPHQPASNTLADLLGYHYYTELAHSAGMPKEQIEDEDLHPRELVQRLVRHLGPIDNTAQYSWLIAICQKFFGFDHDRIDETNWEEAYDLAEAQMQSAEWPQMVLDQSNVEAVFLTNDFDDELQGYNTGTYIPCLRTDDLVFHLAKPQTRARLEACTGIELDGSLMSLRESLRQRFEYFSANGARACAISLPPSFQPGQVSDGRTATALDQVLKKGVLAEPQHQLALSRRVFWTLAELCDEYAMPFDLMIGVNRGVYSNGVFQGQDLYDSRVSLIQYAELFNAFPDVKFPISVLASVTNQELVSYAWIFPNVITNGHWWYSNTPSFIARDAAARLEAVPRTKQIAYYSDAYKLEFVWPKFDMYRRILAGILADHFVGSCGWSEQRAIELGQQVLRDNVEEVFRTPFDASRAETVVDEPAPTTEIEPTVDLEATDDGAWQNQAAAGASAALAAGAIGMVEVSDANESPVESIDERDSTLDGQPGSLEETVDEFSTIYEEEAESLAAEAETPPADVEDIQGFLESEEDRESGQDVSFESDDDIDSPDQPTVHELDDTVKMDTVELEEATDSAGDDDEPDFDDGDDVSALDPLPTDDEIEAVGLDDVELMDDGAEPAITDADAIEEAVDAAPLDVGELLADPNQPPMDPADSGVQMLRGEESFSPDEDSLQLHPDPLTGELRLPVPGSEDDAVALRDDDGGARVDAETAGFDADIDLAEAFVEASEDSGIVETVEIENDSVDISPSSDLDDLDLTDAFVLPVESAAGDDNPSVLDEEPADAADQQDEPVHDEPNALNDLGLDDFELQDEAGIAESPATADDSDDEDYLL